MKEPIYLIELFAGIGSQAKALKNIGMNVIHHKVIEFDKYAVASYNAVHNTNFKQTDITQIKGEDLEITNTQFFTYLLTYSFPCQDLSLAGKGAGMTKGNSTRSGLLWEVERLLNECKELPQYLLLENVSQIHSKKNIEDFKLWQRFLEQKGYINYWEDLNAKNYGIPQNRNRTFMVSIRKDVDSGYDFPKPFELKLRLKNLLEENVEEKYFLQKTLNMRFTQNYIQYDNSGKGYNSQATRAYYLDGLCPTLPSRNNGDKSQIIELKREEVKSLFTDTQAKMITTDGNVKRYINSNIVDKFQEGQCADISFPNGYNKAQRVHNECPAINTTTTSTSFITKINQTPLRIRKLTPKECWRLMGFDDEDFEKAQKINSNAQLYKQAGNSIVVNVLECIFKELFKEKKERKERKERYERMSIFDFIE